MLPPSLPRYGVPHSNMDHVGCGVRPLKGPVVLARGPFRRLPGVYSPNRPRRHEAWTWGSGLDRTRGHHAPMISGVRIGRRRGSLTRIEPTRHIGPPYRPAISDGVPDGCQPRPCVATSLTGNTADRLMTREPVSDLSHFCESSGRGNFSLVRSGAQRRLLYLRIDRYLFSTPINVLRARC
jgi:hypothetical protein